MDDDLIGLIEVAAKNRVHVAVFISSDGLPMANTSSVPHEIDMERYDELFDQALRYCGDRRNAANIPAEDLPPTVARATIRWPGEIEGFAISVTLKTSTIGSETMG